MSNYWCHEEMCELCNIFIKLCNIYDDVNL